MVVESQAPDRVLLVIGILDLDLMARLSMDCSLPQIAHLLGPDLVSERVRVEEGIHQNILNR